MRQFIILYKSPKRDLLFWDGQKWRNLAVHPGDIIPIWKDSQLNRELNFAYAALPRFLDRSQVFWYRVSRIGKLPPQKGAYNENSPE